MKKDKQVMYITMFLNLIVAVFKLVSGIMFNFSSLIADSLQSLFDFVTDVVVMVVSKIGDKRANKRHPFGYGMVENIANLFIGIILIILALFILIRGFMVETSDVTSVIFIILIIVLILKLFIVLMLYFNGKKFKNSTLLMSAKESSTDFVATVIVLIVSILLLLKDKVYIFKYADIVGSVLISIIIFKVAFNIIKTNINYLLGTTGENEDIENKVNDIIIDYRIIKDSKFKMMKIGDYYTLYLDIWLDDDVTLHRMVSLENKLKKKIRNCIREIKYIQVDFKEFK